jgi:hypothetical protein
MTIYPYNDVDEGEIIQDSIELAALTVELRDLLDELPRPQRDRLATLIRDRDREAGRLAYCFGVRAGDLNARLLGRLRKRDAAEQNEEGAGG